MTKKRIQSRIAGSRRAYPIALVLATAVWLARGLVDEGLWLPFALVICTTWIVARTNTIHAIMRTYTRMMACSFLSMSLICLPYFIDPRGAGMALGFAMIFFFLFSTYQDKASVGTVFVTFAMVGFTSLLYVKTLYLVPILWIVLLSRMMAMSPRTFGASLFGLAAPYWFAATYCMAFADIDVMVRHLSGLWQLSPIPDWESVTLGAVAMFSIVVVLMLTGVIHFVNTSHNDKIKTRMIFESYMLMCAALTVFIVLQPKDVALLLPALIVTTAPLLAHYITYTETRLTNLSFLAMIALTALATWYHLWKY